MTIGQDYLAGTAKQLQQPAQHHRRELCLGRNLGQRLLEQCVTALLLHPENDRLEFPRL